MVAASTHPLDLHKDDIAARRARFIRTKEQRKKINNWMKHYFE